MDTNTSQNLQVCPICSVSITENGQVNFSNGRPGTRARLYARVCQYTQQTGCINQKVDQIGEITREDNFESGEELLIHMPGTTDPNGNS